MWARRAGARARGEVVVKEGRDREAVGSAMGAMSGGSSSEPAPAAAPVAQTSGGSCDYQQQDFMSCLQMTSSNASACNDLLSQLTQCQQGGFA